MMAVRSTSAAWSCQVNKYPGQRTFTAIGTGGDDFKATMLAAVESVVGTVHMECVAERPSSGGKYVSVRIGPVWVESADQVSRASSSSSNCCCCCMLCQGCSDDAFWRRSNILQWEVALISFQIRVYASCDKSLMLPLSLSPSVFHLLCFLIAVV